MIVIEGLDGSGKTTLAKYLAKNYGLKLYKFPDYRGFEVIKRFLEGKEKLNEEAAYLLFLSNIIARTKDENGIYDRYVFSTVAYAYNFNIKNAINILKNLHIKKPDLIIYLDINAEMALKRKMEQFNKRKEKRSIREKLDILKIVKRRYDYMASTNLFGKWKRIDASKNIDEMLKEGERIIERYIK